jgi:hypothetical protein
MDEAAKTKRKRQGKRMRRVIVPFDESQHLIIEATARLGGYPGIEEYAKEAILARFEIDREICKAAISKKVSAPVAHSN